MSCKRLDDALPIGKVGDNFLEKSSGLPIGGHSIFLLQGNALLLPVGMIKVTKGDMARIEEDEGKIDGDRLNATVFSTQYGPVLLINPPSGFQSLDVRLPSLALNPFGLRGFRFILALLESDKLAWMLSDGEQIKTTVLHGIGGADVLHRAWGFSLETTKRVEKRDFARAVAQVAKE